jgi:hypothetical protein
MVLARLTEGPEADSPELPKPVLLQLDEALHRTARNLRACMENNDQYDRHPHMVTPAQAIASGDEPTNRYEYLDSHGERIVLSPAGVVSVSFRNGENRPKDIQRMLDELSTEIRGLTPAA